MKKLLCLSFFLASSAFAAMSGSVAELNAEILKILAPLQNTNTVAELAFAKIETSAERALAVQVSGLYRKVGTRDTLELNVENLSYEYGPSPTTNFNGSFGLNLTKILPQDQLNEMIPNIEQMIQDATNEYAGKYGEALQISTEITDRTRDSAGNYTGLKGTVRFQFDFTKLPEGVAIEEIPVSAGWLSLDLNVATGASLVGSVSSNTNYKGFRDDEAGLKEILENLLNRDEKTMGKVVELAQQLDQFANQIVNSEE